MLKRFGFSNFISPWQEEAVLKIYEGHKNVIVSLPTHGGKSLAFQIQNILRKEKTILVFCASLALIENQIMYLRKKRFGAVRLNDETVSFEERREIRHTLKEYPESIEFLFLTPEWFNSDDQLQEILEDMLENEEIQMIVVDEAHLIQDNYKFRPGFAELGNLRAKFPNVQWVTLTTVSQNMLPMITTPLNMSNDLVFIKAPVVRDNIYYDVWITDKVKEALTESIFTFSKHSNKISGIVFVDRKKDADYFAKFLEHTEDFKVESFHPDKPDRFETQQRWMKGETKILVATTDSFGCGVIRNNVKYVIHLCRSKNMRAFYQESGRAGVNGEVSYSRIITEPVQGNDEINSYLWTKDCRRRYICNVFNEGSADCIAKCDNCDEKFHGLE